MNSNSTPLKPLKFLLDFIFIIVVVSIVVNLITVLLIPIFPNSRVLINITEVPIQNWNSSTVILIIGSILLHTGFIYSLYIFKKLVNSFFEAPLFNKFQITTLKLLGQLIILLVIIKSIFNVFSSVVFGETEMVGIHIFSFDSKLMAICMGLFFIYLSYVFKTAKSLRDENDLTV